MLVVSGHVRMPVSLSSASARQFGVARVRRRRPACGRRCLARGGHVYGVQVLVLVFLRSRGGVIVAQLLDGAAGCGEGAGVEIVGRWPSVAWERPALRRASSR